MAIPLIFAAAGIVARYIAKRGVQAAVKKVYEKGSYKWQETLKRFKE